MKYVNQIATAFFALALLAQIGYEISVFGHEPVTLPYLYRFVLILAFALLLTPLAHKPMIEAIARWCIAADFAFAILDRFGVFGPYGAPGVAWGNWANFVAYTHVLNRMLPLAAAPFLAVVATIVEAALVVCLALGLWRRATFAATALLTTIYIITMSFTSGFLSQLDYSVLLICACCIFLSKDSETRAASLAV